MFLQETVFEEKILEFAYVQKMHFFFNILQNPFFLKFLFYTEMHWNDPWKRSQKPELKLLYTLLEFKNVFRFVFFLVEISCSIQYKYLQDEPLPRRPRWLQGALGATEGRGAARARAGGVCKQSTLPRNASCCGIRTLTSSQLAHLGTLRAGGTPPKPLHCSPRSFHPAEPPKRAAISRGAQSTSLSLF